MYAAPRIHLDIEEGYAEAYLQQQELDAHTGPFSSMESAATVRAKLAKATARLKGLHPYVPTLFVWPRAA